MTNSMKSENKPEGVSNYRAWKKRIDLKVLDLVQGKVKETVNEAGKEKYKETNLLGMNLIMDGLKDNLIPYISNIESAKAMSEALSKLFTIKNIGQIASLKNELRTIRMTRDDTISSYFVRISRIRDELQTIDEVVPEKELIIVSLLGLPKS